MAKVVVGKGFVGIAHVRVIMVHCVLSTRRYSYVLVKFWQYVPEICLIEIPSFDEKPFGVAALNAADSIV